MSTRCRGCNRILFQTETMMINFETGEREDLCNICRSKSYDEYTYMDDKEYVLGDLKEGLAPAYSPSY